ncbi:MAG: hypothetical protein M3Y56_02530 [Armatimonadota bacterium]|nr:hypothetical protein [Armatimonadota bacterium]
MQGVRAAIAMAGVIVHSLLHLLAGITGWVLIYLALFGMMRHGACWGYLWIALGGLSVILVLFEATPDDSRGRS